MSIKSTEPHADDEIEVVPELSSGLYARIRIRESTNKCSIFLDAKQLLRFGDECRVAAQNLTRERFTIPCCPHPVERHAYNGCANCSCNVRWAVHPDRHLDRSEAAWLELKAKVAGLEAEIVALKNAGRS